MKLHRSAKIRHNKCVEAATVEPRVATYRHPEPYHLRFQFDDNASSVLTMTREECKELFQTLGVMLRYEGAAAHEIDTDDWIDTHMHMKRVMEKETKDEVPRNE